MSSPAIKRRKVAEEIKSGSGDEKITYTVRIETNNQWKNSKRPKGVSIELFGIQDKTNHKTPPTLFEPTSYHGDERYRIEDAKIEFDASDDVGLPTAVKISVPAPLVPVIAGPEWMINNIYITRNGEERVYPVYDWVDTMIMVTKGEGCLPQNVNDDLLKMMRKQEIEKAKGTLLWRPFPNKNEGGWGLPAYLDIPAFGANKVQETILSIAGAIGPPLLPKPQSDPKYLPKIFRMETERHDYFVKRKLHAVGTLVKNKTIGDALKLKSAVSELIPGMLEKLLKIFTKATTLDDFHKLYEYGLFPEAMNLDISKWQNEHFLKDWDTDEGMGRQTLTGISPIHMCRLNSRKELPKEFNPAGESMDNLVEESTFDQAVKAGKVYISNYKKTVEGVKRNVNVYKETKPGEEPEELYCANSIALFYVNPSGDFIPIAIQLEPNDDEYYYTKHSGHLNDHNMWKMAKMHYRVAQANVHEWSYHYLLTHAICEPVCIALFRCLPRNHPIYKLMRPHLQTVVWINTDARHELIPDDMANNQAFSINAGAMAQKGFKDLRYEDLNIPKLLKRKGLDDKEKLPNYHYRDDALLIWDALEKHFTNVIMHYYKHDRDVVNDFELQDFIKETSEDGIGWESNGKDCKGFPRSFKTRAQLVEFCTTMAFTGSAQHAAVNFGQFETMKFVPNCPTCMRTLPCKNSEWRVTEREIIDMLPNIEQATTVITTVWALSSWCPEEVEEMLLDDDKVLDLFTESKVKKMEEIYKNNMQQIENKISDRNAKLGDFPYTYLLPSRVTKSIAI